MGTEGHGITESGPNHSAENNSRHPPCAVVGTAGSPNSGPPHSCMRGQIPHPHLDGCGVSFGVTPRQTCPRPRGLGRNLRSKTRWFTGFCNSHHVSHFATFFIDARAEISVAESHSIIFRATNARHGRGPKAALIQVYLGVKFAPVLLSPSGPRREAGRLRGAEAAIAAPVSSVTVRGSSDSGSRQ